MPDISRSTFRREKHYDTVRMQQGRVLLDADQNESEDIHRYLRETTARDIIGRTGVPRDNPGFRIVIGPGGEPLISAGRMYVDGILCECEGTFRVAGTSPNAVIDNDNALDPGSPIDSAATARTGAIVPDAIVPDAIVPPLGLPPIASLVLDDTSPLLAKDAAVEVFGIVNGAPSATTHTVTGTNGKTIGIQPALPGGALVHFVSALVPWSKQPDFFGGSLPSGNYMLYLDVWRREITHLEDPDIREVALGGPDTTTRTKTVWQVRALQNGTCAGFTSPRKNDARMAAKAVPAITSKPCEIPEAAGYRRLENQLYRVQIHKSSTEPGGPTFKWSRDNGAIVFPLDPAGANATKIELRSIGLDERTSLHDSDWVEVINDLNDLDAKPGQMVQVKNAPEASGKVVELLAPVPGSFDRKKNARLRVWGDPSLSSAELPVDTTKFVEIEDGIQVRFSGTEFNSGDYWLIPARTAISEDTGTILWPVANGNPLFLRPEGIAHHYAPLAEVTSGSVKDCRQIFAPITTPDLFYVSGDGQNIKPAAGGGLAELPCELRVRVSNGTPVPGAKVTFTLPAGQAGQLVPGSQTTGADGVIECKWRVNATDADQYATATLDLPGTTHAKPQIIFHAQLDLTKDAGTCTIVIREGDDVVQRFDELKDIRDIEICFGTGDFTVAQPLRLINRKRVKVTGAGPATRINGGRNKTFVFDDCEEILIRDLTATARAFRDDGAPEPAGVLSFHDCDAIAVEHVAATCANASETELACLTALKCDTVRIRDCDLFAGADQYGIYVADADVAIIEGNVIVGRGRVTGDFQNLDTIVSNFRTVTPRRGRATGGGAGGLTIGAINMTFDADPDVSADIARVIAETDASTATDAASARRVLTDAITAVAADEARLGQFPGLNRIITRIERGGARFGIFTRAIDRNDMNVTIRDNDIRGANVGIQAGVLAFDDDTAKAVARVNIDSNQVAMLAAQMPAAATPAPPVGTSVLPNISAVARLARMVGIVFGSCGSLLIDDNLLTAPDSVPLSAVIQSGILGFGTFGPFALIRANDIRQFAFGAAIGETGVPRPVQWRLITNLAAPQPQAWFVNRANWVLENNVPPT